MNLTDIIQKAADIIGLEITINYESPSAALSKLLDSARMIYSELTLEHIPLKTRERITIEGGRGYYRDLSKPVREILSVYRGDRKLKQQMYPTYFKTEDVDGEVEVIYLFHLTDIAPDDELVLPPQFTVYTLAMGVVSEYYYRTGMVDEALFYKTRYDNSIGNLSRTLKGVSVPSRRFIW